MSVDSSTPVVEKVLESARKLSDKLNNLLDTFVSLHNSRRKALYIKLENISKTAYFLNTKKRYALYVINREGVPVDEIETKGLSINRSDYPQVTRKYLTELLELLLKEEKIDLKKIDDFVLEKEKEITQLCISGDVSVGRPVSYTKKDYKTTREEPFHVLGMMLWNSLEQNTFVSGSKGYMFRIKGVDPSEYESVKGTLAPLSSLPVSLAKSNYIVIPENLRRVPSYYIIDVDWMLKFVWLDRVEELLAPLGGTVYTRRSKSFDDVYNFETFFKA